MSKKVSELSKNNFQFLMDCIAEKTEPGADLKEGLLYFIKDSLIAERVVTKYSSTSLEYFKAFFCNVVLEMYSGSELNFKEFEKYFANENEKNYAINTEKMDSYLDRQENIRYIQEDFPETKSCENWEDLFQILLIERLQQVSHQCLKEYFLVDKKVLEEKKKFQYTIDNKRTRDFDEIKKRLLRRVACAACLYEIFVCKFLEPDSQEEIFTALEVLKGNAEQIMLLAKEFQTQTEVLKEKQRSDEETASAMEAIKNLTEQLEVVKTEIISTTDQAMYSITKAHYYFSHIRYVMTLCAVISILEYININNRDSAMPKKWKSPEAVGRMKDIIYDGQCEFLLFDRDTDIKLNKNHCDVYKKVTEVLEEERLIQELCSKERKVQEKAMILLQRYFMGIMEDAGGKDTDFLSAVNAIFCKCLK